MMRRGHRLDRQSKSDTGKVLKRSERWVDVQVFHVQLNVNEWIRFKREIKIGEEIEV